MFEIGNTLREARLRRGIEIPQAEAETKIRAKYLRAMEEEQFDLLPAPSYVRGFLKSYAEYLGLDGRLVLDEYESRFGALADVFGGDDAGTRPGGGYAPSGFASGAPRRAPSRGRRGRTRARRDGRGTEAKLLWLAIGGVMGVALLTWMGAGGDDRASTRPVPDTAGAARRSSGATSTPSTPAVPAVPRPGLVRVSFTGTGENGSWLEVRGRNAGGPAVYTGTLGPGSTQSYRVRRSLWVRVGDSAGVEVVVNGRRRALTGGAPAEYVVTRRGVRLVDSTG